MENGKTFIGNEKLEFRQIILGHLKHILNLSLRSNRDGEKLSLYFNSIEVLADVLIPFYDEQMNNEVEVFESEFNKINEEKGKKEKALCPRDFYDGYMPLYNSKKKKIFRNLFRKLNLLLKRNDYLKSSVYGESKDELAQEDDSEDE